MTSVPKDPGLNPTDYTLDFDLQVALRGYCPIKGKE